jgi:acetyl esterase/lipase
MLALLFDLLYCRIYQLLRGIKPTTYVYTQYGHIDRSLDVYLPDNDGQPAPVILFLHGGAWKLGSRKNLQSGILHQLKRGYALVGVSYSFSQEAHWPRQLFEVKAAVRWLRAHAQQLNIDPSCIILWGISAGGHIASVVGTSNGQASQEGDLGHPEQSSEVQAVIAWYPPTDFLALGNINAFNKRGFYRTTKKLLGAREEDYVDKAALANPVHYISPATSPFLIQHGSLDQIVPTCQSELLFAALQAAGIPVTYELKKGYVHGDLRFNTASNLISVNAFLDSISKESTVFTR